MTFLALLGEPFTEAPKRDASSVAHDGDRIRQPGVNQGPESADLRANVLAASLNGEAERSEGGFAEGGVR